MSNGIDLSPFDLVCTVSPTADGKYECPCGYHPSRTVYPDLEAYKSHLQHLIEICKNSHKEPPIILGNELIQTATLRRYSLIINTTFHLLICATCSAAILPQHFSSHTRNVHNEPAETFDVNLVRTIAAEFGVPDTYPILPSTPFGPIDGLPILEGYQCPASACNRAYALQSSLEAHFRKAHAGQRFTKETLAVQLQRLNNGAQTKTYFVVNPPAQIPPLASDESILAAAADTLKTQYADERVSDVRNISPWLRVTRWTELLTKHGVAELVKIAEYPSRSEYPTLQDIVEETMARSAASIDRANTLTLQILNSPRGPHEISNKPFKMHNDGSTLGHYTRVVTALVAGLLRVTLVPLPTKVQECLEDFKNSLSCGSTDEACESLHTLLISIWTRKWPVTEQDRVADPTILYLAISSLTSTGRFQEPKNVTHTIACLEYMMRLVFLKAIHSFPSVDEGLTCIQPWFIEKTESTFNSLRTLQHFASSIAYQTMGLPRIWWTDRTGHKSMLYRGHPVKLEHIFDMLRELERQIQEIWERDILLSLPLSVQYSCIHDDLSNKDPGYSFTTDPKNTIFEDKQMLLAGILGRPSLRSKFISDESSGVVHWNARELRQWLISYANLGLLILVRCNLTGGSPGRITELTAMQLVNLATYAVRNLVMFDKHLALLCTYLKTSALTGYDRLIPHSLDSFTSDILIQDLAIARPFARFAARVCHSNRPDIIKRFDTHVFVNHTTLFVTEDVTQALAQLSLPYLEFSLNVNAWRHISTAFRRIHCGRFQRLLDDSDSESADALQSGHSKWTENRLYGLSHDTLSGAGEDVLPLFLDASTEWQFVCRVVPGGTGLPFRDTTMASFESLLQDGMIQRPHSDRGMTLSEMFHALERTILERFDDLQRRFLPSPTCHVSSSNSTDTLCFSDEDLESRALGALRRALGSQDAEWACREQKTSVLAMLEHKHDAIVIMATGSGKSMIPIIPSLVEDARTTVLILPFRSLVVDFTAKLTRMSVPFEVYSPGKRLSSMVNLVIVSADHATTDGWRESIMMVNMGRPVARYVLDEAHIPSTTWDYREALKYMSDIRCSFPVQLALLTATAHDRLVAVMRKEFCLGADTLVIRMSTNRPELQYVWPTSPPANISVTIQQLVQDKIKGIEDRALIFVPFLNDGQSLSKELGYPFYHGKLEPCDQNSFYHDWTTGASPVLIATSAFGTGNDYPHVRLVIHLGTPFEMVSFIQEVSRAGRDKFPATCVLFQSEHRRYIPTHITLESDLSGRISMDEAICKHPARCIRFILTSYIDGRGIYCSSLPNNQICSRCASHSERKSRDKSFEASTQEAKRLRFDRESQESTYVTNFKKQLSRFNNSCAFCLLFDVITSAHDIKQCPTLVTKLGKDGYGQFFDWRRRIQYSSYHTRICFFCHVPQGPNDALHPTFQRQKGACKYPDVVAPAVFAILIDGTLRRRLSDHFGVEFDSPTAALDFINSTPVPFHCSNLTAIFLWYPGK